jgi:hypothetical protein
MKKCSFLFLFLSPFLLVAQDLTGTWEGELITDGNAREGIQRTFKIKWEIVQIEKEVFGIVYFYPQDTRPNDKPNVWYTWYGKQGKTKSFPFQFIQGRYIDGPTTVNTYQFNVKFEQKDSIYILSGTWYNQLEALNSQERPAGFYSLKRISTLISDQLWMKRKEKEILEKIEKQNKTYSE